MNLIEGNLYTRKTIWKQVHTELEYPNGGPWATGYVQEGEDLLAFANIGSSGRTGHNFPNHFDDSTKKMEWYGKPNAHSEQPTFRKLFQGKTKLLMFARWDSSSPLFTYLGNPKILKFTNDIKVSESIRTIKLDLSFQENLDQNWTERDINTFSEGKKTLVLSAKYERNPRLRAECIRIHGFTCKICEFNFEDNFGELGENFCHVHHIKPLSEIGHDHQVDPSKDLIPVCPNCHAMLHRTIPAMLPKDLRALIEEKKTK